MTITNTLNNALSGLRANGKLAEITAGNLANALTPGYGRQSVILDAASVGGHGAGVRVAGVQRALDPELSGARRLADGDLAGQTAVFDGLRRLETAFGTSNDPGSLHRRIGTVETALRDLAETPEAPSRQQAAAEALSDLANKFRQISTETVRVRETADADIARKVDQVNSALKKIATLNRQIQIFDANGRETAPLIDERERLIDQVAQNVPIRETRRDDGTIEIRTQQGIPLADIRAQTITFAPTPTFGPGLTYDGGNGILSGLTVMGMDITPGGPGTQQIQGGALAGLFSVRDEIAPEAEARIDSLAADLIRRTAGSDPTVTAGNPGLFTDRQQAFDGVPVTGIAARIELNAAVDPFARGDPTLLRDGLESVIPRAASDPTLPRTLLDALRAPLDAGTAPATPGVSGH
jgi:flagellar hook-associated protein 1 FlgK